DLTGHSTGNLSGTTPGMEALSECWYIAYTDENGVVHTVKGSVKGIRRSLKENLLGDTEQIRVAKSKAGPFTPLRIHPEFRDLIIQPENVPTPKNVAALKQVIAKKPPASTTDSGELTTTVIFPQKEQQAVVPVPEGPCINLKATDNGSE